MTRSATTEAGQMALDIEAVREPANPWPRPWRDQHEALRYFGSLDCEQLAQISYQYTRAS